MDFSKLSEYLDNLEQTTSRNDITVVLSDLLKESNEEVVAKVVYLILGKISPSYESTVFNIAERMVVETIARAYDTTKEEVISLYKERGDLGDVAYYLAEKGEKIQKPLDVNRVFDALVDIAKEDGQGSVEKKISKFAILLKSLDPLSVKYVTRIPLGKLRLGFSEKTVIDAISWMEKGDKSASKQLSKAYNVLPDAGLLAQKAKKVGIEKAVKEIEPQIGVPILPMLAQRLRSAKEMVDKMGEVAVEPKLDGLRLQIHYKKGENPKAFTRNLNETSWMFPELQNIKHEIDSDEVILDVEAVGLSEDTKKLANFQTTMTRRRKHDIDESADKVPIRFYAFDILFKNNEELLHLKYLERRKILEETIKSKETLQLVDYIVTDNPKIIIQKHHEYLAEGLEGIIVKSIDGKYISGRTGWRWVKMKEPEGKEAKLSDTIDVVVMGYTQGRGKRAQFGIGQFLAGIRDGEEIKTVTKVGTGLTDDQFRELHQRLEKIKTVSKPRQYEVNKNLEPDFWVEPKLVVELAADEITKSPIHTAGYALRFPRLVNFRDDKSAKEATTIKELMDISGL